jgi:hypothetical protein
LCFLNFAWGGAAAPLGCANVKYCQATSLTPNTWSTLTHSGPSTYNSIRTVHHISVNHSLTLLKMGKDCPKHVELIQRSIKLLLLHLVGHYNIHLQWWCTVKHKSNCQHFIKLMGVNSSLEF